MTEDLTLDERVRDREPVMCPVGWLAMDRDSRPSVSKHGRRRRGGGRKDGTHRAPSAAEQKRERGEGE